MSGWDSGCVNSGMGEHVFGTKRGLAGQELEGVTRMLKQFWTLLPMISMQLSVKYQVLCKSPTPLCTEFCARTWQCLRNVQNSSRRFWLSRTRTGECGFVGSIWIATTWTGGCSTKWLLVMKVTFIFMIQGAKKDQGNGSTRMTTDPRKHCKDVVDGTAKLFLWCFLITGE